MLNAKPKTIIFSDKPTRDDHLNFQDYAQVLADIALNSETPTTIGIFGEWGSGKSSLTMMVDDLLKENNVRTIWFNAWKYDKEDALWRSMILRILDGLDAKTGDVEDIRRRLYTAISAEELGKIEINWLEAGKSLAKQGIKVAGTIAFPLAGIGNVIANIGKTVLNTKSIEDISKAVTRQTIERSQDRISSIEEFDKLYSELIVKLLGKNERLVVFIDDLDRCSPVQALLVLEALKSFLAAERCIYIVACDPRLIQKGFEKKYGASSEQEVSDYLEKIVQIYFEIPPLRAEDTENYLTKLGVGDEAKAITQIVMSGLESNPRKLKRFLNNLEIQYRLVLARSLGIEKNVLTKLACITYGWKNLWLQILENPPLLSELQNYAVDKELEIKVGINPVIKEIFEKNNRLRAFLEQQPYFSKDELEAYIFLAKTTRADISNISSQALSEQTSDVRLLKNPFIAGNPIVRSEMFFDREYELRDAMSNLLHERGSALSIFGQRRIGKTSFLLHLERNLRNEGALPIYIDLQGYFGFLENSNSFLYSIAQSISRSIAQSAPKIAAGLAAIDTNKKELSPDQFDNFIDKAFSFVPEKIIILLFDEFEMLFDKIREGKLGVEILNYLRFLVSKYPSFKMVFCSSKGLSEIAKEQNILSMTSPFYNITKNIKLGYFGREVSIALIETPLFGILEYEQNAVDYFAQQAGGHPFLIQAISSNIVNDINEQGLKIVKKEDVESAIQKTLDFQSTFFTVLFAEENLYNVAREIAITLSDETDQFTADDIYRASVKSNISEDVLRDVEIQLYTRDILIRSTDESNNQIRYKFAVPIYARWLKNKSIIFMKAKINI